ncbi:MAG: hypothetical protein ACI4MS_02285 [Candidatus Coproplasma sp.]
MTENQIYEDKKRKEFIDGIYADFKRRQEERRLLERSWQLNLNFIAGNQYCDVNPLGEVEEDNSGYYWQERRVFNYIAPVMETRCSRLTGLRPKLAVRSASDDDDDKRASALSSAILSASYEDCDLENAVTMATYWTEACGTAFYKVIWDSDAGNEIGITADGAKIKEGKVKVIAVSPFEIYPDSLSEEDLYSQPSIIHARAVPVSDIYLAYGVALEGRDIEDCFSLSPRISPAEGVFKQSAPKGVKHGYEIVIEKYSRPTAENPEGRLTIVAGGELLYDGALPYVNGDNGERIYPFVRQMCMPVLGNFFGKCIVERLIPVQRAYNAVKNRKHEFLNRISMGMIAVEDGSVDTDELCEDGLVPGKILIYRQGSTPPEMLTLGTIPAEFTEEEQRLEEEFAKISGTNDITQKANAYTSVTSATGLQLIIEQEEARMNVCYDQIKSALKSIGRLILRMYRQFATGNRLLRYAGKNGTLSVLNFKGSDISGDDVVLEADSDANLTPARRRVALYEMLDRGLFTDADGKLSPSIKAKLLETLGYNGYSAEKDLEELNALRCAEENEKLKGGTDCPIKEYDDHAVHVREHTAYLLSEKLTDGEEGRICAHLQLHKNKLSEVKNEG